MIPEIACKMQEVADDFREWRMTANQNASKRRLARRDHWREQIGLHWHGLLPPWAIALVVGACIGLCVWMLS